MMSHPFRSHHFSVLKLPKSSAKSPPPPAPTGVGGAVQQPVCPPSRDISSTQARLVRICVHQEQDVGILRHFHVVRRRCHNALVRCFAYGILHADCVKVRC